MAHNQACSGKTAASHTCSGMGGGNFLIPAPNKRFIVRADKEADCVSGTGSGDSSDQLTQSVTPCRSRHLRFCFGGPAKRQRKHRKHLQRRRVIAATEKRREVEAH